MFTISFFVNIVCCFFTGFGKESDEEACKAIFDENIPNYEFLFELRNDVNEAWKEHKEVEQEIFRFLEEGDDVWGLVSRRSFMIGSLYAIVHSTISLNFSGPSLA